MVGDLFALSLSSEALKDYLTPDCYLSSMATHILSPQYEQAARTWMRVMASEYYLLVDGEKLPAWEIGLNSAMKTGSDAVKLMARLHAQCEIHAYVKGQNRVWLSNIIAAGRASGILRADMGWDPVIELLRADHVGTVVTSYSVCRQFPNPNIIGATEEQWEGMTLDRQWNECVAALESGDGLLELQPENWLGYVFGRGVNGFMLEAKHNERRIREEARSGLS